MSRSVPTQRTWTLEEAREALPKVRELVPPLREALTRYRFAKEQVADLEAMFEGTPPLVDPDHPEHEDYMRLKAEQVVREREAMDLLDELLGMGVEVKDPLLGLVDFPALRDDEPVYLCWQDGEDDVAAWHPREAGFAGRRPLSEW